MSADQARPERSVATDDIEQLVSVSARINRTSAVLLSSLDVPLTFRQYRTLTRVMSGFSTLRQLAIRGNLSIPSVSENIDGLVKRGLMETRPSREDRRAITLHITPAGEAAVAAGERVLHDFIESLIAGFTPKQRGDLSELLAGIYDAATDYFSKHLADRAN